MSTTIKDVAERAGVSKALVSRYLNGKTGVSKENRSRIAEAIQALHYTPNALARSLVTQKTFTIGVLMEVLDTDPALSVLRGLEHGMQQIPGGDQYTLIYTSSFGDVKRKARQLQYLTRGRADGIIIFGSQICNDELISRLAETEFPIVLIENDLSAARADRVLVDNVGGAFEATETLIRAGHSVVVADNLSNSSPAALLFSHRELLMSQAARPVPSNSPPFRDVPLTWLPVLISTKLTIVVTLHSRQLREVTPV